MHGCPGGLYRPTPGSTMVIRLGVGPSRLCLRSLASASAAGARRLVGPADYRLLGRQAGPTVQGLVGGWLLLPRPGDEGFIEVTGVQTCALPIYPRRAVSAAHGRWAPSGRETPEGGQASPSRPKIEPALHSRLAASLEGDAPLRRQDAVRLYRSLAGRRHCSHAHLGEALVTRLRQQ